jgi:hypothetical protein
VAGFDFVRAFGFVGAAFGLDLALGSAGGAFAVTAGGVERVLAGVFGSGLAAKVGPCGLGRNP